jgi:hypothetical protein
MPTGNNLAVFTNEKAASQSNDLVLGIEPDDSHDGWLNFFNQGGDIFLGLDRSTPGPE